MNEPSKAEHGDASAVAPYDHQKQWDAATHVEQDAAQKAFWSYWDALRLFSGQRRPNFDDLPAVERSAWLKAARTAIGVHERAKLRL